MREVHETMTQALHLALLGAMPEEIGSDLSHLKDLTCSDHGDLTIHRGSWGDDVRISLAWSGWEIGRAHV